jgi:hypothetical protein
MTPGLAEMPLRVPCRTTTQLAGEDRAERRVVGEHYVSGLRLEPLDDIRALAGRHVADEVAETGLDGGQPTQALGGTDSRVRSQHF